MFEARRRRKFLTSAAKEIDRILKEVGEDSNGQIPQDGWSIDYDLSGPNPKVAGELFGLWIAHCIHEGVTQLQLYCGEPRLLCIKDTEMYELVVPGFVLVASVIMFIVQLSDPLFAGGTLQIPCKRKRLVINIEFAVYGSEYLQITGFND